MFQDKTLACRDCGQSFVFSSSEQEFYAEKGFQNDPVRCPDCRKAKKASRGSFGGGRQDRQLFEVTCSECGQPAQVPFKPSNDRPVYCKDCYGSKRVSL